MLSDGGMARVNIISFYRITCHYEVHDTIFKYLPCAFLLFTEGNIHLQFHASGNHYVWSKVTSTVHNIIVGKLWIDQVCSSYMVSTVEIKTCL